MDSKPTETTVKPPGGASISLKKIKAHPVDWLWTDRVPADAITLVDGHPGSGKSTLAAAIMSHVAGGQPLPGETKQRAACVAWFTREEGYAQSVVPRLVAAGTDLRKVMLPTDGDGSTVLSRWSLPSAINFFTNFVHQHRIRLMVFDPVTSFLDGGTSLRDDAAIRAALEPVASLCRECRCAVVMLRHFRKGTSGTAGEQGAGSYAFSAVCRVQIGCYSDPDNPGAKTVAWIKSNLGKLPSSQGMRCVVRGDGVRAEFTGASARSAESLAEGSGDAAERSAGADAETLLRVELEDSRKLAADLKKFADAVGITPKQLRRAKERLRVISENVWEDGVRKWYWTRPKKWPDA